MSPWLPLLVCFVGFTSLHSIHGELSADTKAFLEKVIESREETSETEIKSIRKSSAEADFFDYSKVLKKDDEKYQIEEEERKHELKKSKSLLVHFSPERSYEDFLATKNDWKGNFDYYKAVWNLIQKIIDPFMKSHTVNVVLPDIKFTENDDGFFAEFSGMKANIDHTNFLIFSTEVWEGNPLNLIFEYSMTIELEGHCLIHSPHINGRGKFKFSTLGRKRAGGPFNTKGILLLCNETLSGPIKIELQEDSQLSINSIPIDPKEINDWLKHKLEKEHGTKNLGVMGKEWSAEIKYFFNSFHVKLMNEMIDQNQLTEIIKNLGSSNKLGRSLRTWKEFVYDNERVNVTADINERFGNGTLEIKQDNPVFKKKMEKFIKMIESFLNDQSFLNLKSLFITQKEIDDKLFQVYSKFMDWLFKEIV